MSRSRVAALLAALFLALAVAAKGRLWDAAPGGNFYDLFPHNLLVGLSSPGRARRWRSHRPRPRP